MVGCVRISCVSVPRGRPKVKVSGAIVDGSLVGSVGRRGPLTCERRMWEDLDDMSLHRSSGPTILSFLGPFHPWFTWIVLLFTTTVKTGVPVFRRHSRTSPFAQFRRSRSLPPVRSSGYRIKMVKFSFTEGSSTMYRP